MTAETAADDSRPSVQHRFGRPCLLPLPPRRPLDDPGAPFPDLLYAFRLRANLSQSALGLAAGVNSSYINRLESGVRGAPTAAVALALAAGLALSPAETDRFLWSAGGLPPSLQRLASGDPTVLAVARLLGDQRLSPAALADFRACVEAMAHRWRGGAR
jgi:transcriptional regulator with XRE-family HTH domain